MKHRENFTFKETRYKGVEWIHLTQNMDQWQAHVNTVMKLQVL